MFVPRGTLRTQQFSYSDAQFSLAVVYVQLCPDIEQTQIATRPDAPTHLASPARPVSALLP